MAPETVKVPTIGRSQPVLRLPRSDLLVCRQDSPQHGVRRGPERWKSLLGNVWVLCLEGFVCKTFSIFSPCHQAPTRGVSDLPLYTLRFFSRFLLQITFHLLHFLGLSFIYSLGMRPFEIGLLPDESCLAVCCHAKWLNHQQLYGQVDLMWGETIHFSDLLFLPLWSRYSEESSSFGEQIYFVRLF